MEKLRSFSFDLYAHAKYDRSHESIVDIKTMKHLSYGELYNLSTRVWQLMEQLGLNYGDLVLSLLPNCLSHMVFFIGLTSGGFSFSPLSSDSTVDEIHKTINILKPKLILVPPYMNDELKNSIVKKGAVYAVDDNTVLSDLPYMESCQLTKRDSESAILYTRTSGTTGNPKFIAHSIDTLWTAAKSFNNFHNFICPQDRFLNIFNLDSFASLFNVCLIPLAARAAIIYDSEFPWCGTGARIWHNIDSYKATLLWLVPTLLEKLVEGINSPANHINRKIAANLKAVMVGMWNVNEEHKKIFMKEYKVPVLENFSLTETTFISCENIQEKKNNIETVNHSGEILPWVDVTFRSLQINPNDQPHYANDHNMKEILVKSPFTCLGYMHDKGELEPLQKDEDGFFPTEDLGFLTNDCKLKILGRKREVIKIENELINLKAIESIIQEHPDVSIAASVGVQHRTLGENYVLFIKTWHHKKDKKIELETWLHNQLPRRFWPAQVILTDDIPLTASGKICKWLLSQNYKGY